MTEIVKFIHRHFWFTAVFKNIYLLPTGGFSFQVFLCLWIGPPPSPWTDASGLSVDASGLVPPHQFWKGGGTGGQPKNYYKMYNFVYTTLNNHEIT